MAGWLEGRRAGLAARSEAMSAAYRVGRTSGGIDLAAYLAARLPATYAVNARVLNEVAALHPDFRPCSLADVGAGPGTAGWAALAQWPSIAAVEQVEAAPAFVALLRELNAGSGLAALTQAEVREQALVQWQGRPQDLVTASYVLAEMPLASVGDAVRKLWAATGQMLVLIEPGTPEGFKRIHAAREVLRGVGAAMVAPCTHGAACPMAGGNWCHFKERVQRSRAHMHAKGATVPFEDEPYSYLVVAKAPLSPSDSSPNELGEREVVLTRHAGEGPRSGEGERSRILAPPEVSKIGVGLTLCKADGVARQMIKARDKAAYKRAKKLAWGDRWPSA